MDLSTVKHEWRLDTEHGRIHAPFCYFFWVDLEKEGPIFFFNCVPNANTKSNGQYQSKGHTDDPD